jgi:transposase
MRQRRYEITDFEWAVIEPLLPNKPRGVPPTIKKNIISLFV